MSHTVRATGSKSRRRFIQGSLALAGLGLLSACGIVGPPAQQPARVPRIGWQLGVTGGGPTQDAFLEGLREFGYVDGQTIAIERRYVEDRPERLPQIMAEFVSLEVDVIVVVGNAAIRAAKEATSTTPIVMLVSSDPVGDGLVASLARPGGNVTGLSSIAVATVGKRLELLREILPPLGRLSVLWNTTEASKARELQELRGQAQSVGVDLHSAGVTSPEDLDDGLATATTAHADALLVLGDPLMNSHRARIADFAASNRLPSMSEGQEFVLAGGLACYGRNLPDLFRRGATYVDKILKGAKPADLPVEQPTKFDLVINLQTAQALGLTIPPSVLQQATEVIQ